MKSNFNETEKKLIEKLVRKFFWAFGWVLIIYAVTYSIVLTKHFGGNWWPETIPEMLVDISGLLMFIIGLFLSKIKNNEK